MELVNFMPLLDSKERTYGAVFGIIGYDEKEYSFHATCIEGMAYIELVSEPDVMWTKTPIPNLSEQSVHGLPVELTLDKGKMFIDMGCVPRETINLGSTSVSMLKLLDSILFVEPQSSYFTLVKSDLISHCVGACDCGMDASTAGKVLDDAIDAFKRGPMLNKHWSALSSMVKASSACGNREYYFQGAWGDVGCICQLYPDERVIHIHLARNFRDSDSVTCKGCFLGGYGFMSFEMFSRKKVEIPNGPTVYILHNYDMELYCTVSPESPDSEWFSSVMDVAKAIRLSGCDKTEEELVQYIEAPYHGHIPSKGSVRRTKAPHRDVSEKIAEVTAAIRELASMTENGGLYIEDIDCSGGLYAFSGMDCVNGNLRIKASMWKPDSFANKTGLFRD